MLATQQMTRQLGSQQAPVDGGLDLVYAYLAHEVSEQQPPHVRDFLLQTAVLRWMTVDLCNALLHRDDAAQVFRNLEAQYLFIERIEDQNGGPRFRYHPLFHEFLSEQLARWDPHRRVVLCRQSADLYVQEGDLEEAIRLYLDAGERLEAARLMNSLEPGLFDAGHRSTLIEWHQELGDQAPSSPVLQIQAAKAWFARDDYDRALELLDAIEESAAGLEVLPEVWLQRGFIWYRRAGIESAMNALQPIKDSYAAGTVQAYDSRIRGLCLQRLGQSDQARTRLCQALGIYEQLGDRLNQCRVLTDLSSVAFCSGNIQERLDYQHRAVELARRLGHPLSSSN